MKAEIILVTPELATEWLEKNTANRHVSFRQVDKIAGEMIAGNWKTTHQGIAFYSDGVLADGQHRLAAIAQCGISQKMLVTTGLERSDASGIDQHRPRSVVDTIKIGYEVDWINKDTVSVCRFLLGYGTTKIASISDIYAFAELNRPYIEFANSCFTRNKRGVTMASTRSAICVADMNGIDRNDLHEFVSILISGIASSQFHISAIRLREKLISAPGGGAAEQNEKYLCTQRALQAFVARQPLAKLYTPTQPIWTLPADNFPASA